MSENLNNQQKLEEVYHMTMENNEILRSMRRQQHIAHAFTIFYWVVILGALGGAYYYVRPVVNAFSENKGKIDSALEQFNDLRSQLPETKVLNQLLEGLKQSSGLGR